MHFKFTGARVAFCPFRAQILAAMTLSWSARFRVR
jgi:hypothetical protein